MVGCQNIAFLTTVAFSWLRPRFVLAILLPPFDLIMTSSAYMDIGRFKYLLSLFALRIVFECKRVLMCGGVPLFLFLGGVAILWHLFKVFVRET